MIKKITASLVFSLLLMFGSQTVAAQNINDIFQDFANDSQAVEVLFTEILSDDFTKLSSPSLFKANPQFSEERYNNIEYSWDFGDNNKDKGREVVHTYAKPGLFTASLTVTADGETWSTTKDIFIAEKAALLITDETNDAESITKFIKNGRNSFYFISIVESFASQSDFLSEEILTRKLNKLGDEVKNYETIMLWSNNTSGANALLRYNQNLKAQDQTEDSVFTNKDIILIKDSVNSIQKETRIFRQLRPRQIISIPKFARNDLIESVSLNEYKQELIEQDINHEVITSYETNISPFNVFSYFIDYLVNQGIPDNTILLLLLLPVIATTIALFKQVIGLSTMGIYMPSIITMAFLILGIKFGLITFLFIIATGVIAHKILDPLKLLYVPKMALVITTVSIGLFLLITLTVYLKFFAIEFISLTIFPVLIMGTLTERFARLTSTNGFKGSLFILGETLFVCIFTYVITGGAIDLYFINIQFSWLRNVVLNHPEIIVLIIALNAYLGKWTGLQVTEILKFRHIINDLEE